MLSRKDDVLWRRLRMGMARLGKWRAQVLHEGDGICEACGTVPETLWHVLMGCVAWNVEREAMWREIGGRGPRSIQRLLTSDEKEGGSIKHRVRTIRRYLDRIHRREYVIMV